jgi:isoquinoline 1-oxidoreductase beta subunit
VTSRWAPAVVEQMIDPFVLEAATNYPYDVPNVRVTYLQHEIGINVGYWRSVSHATNCFAAECFMDELAGAAKQDPLQFRLSLLERQPETRWRRVLERAAARASWGNAAAGRFQGIALMEGYGTYMSLVAEISLQDGKARVHKISGAADCGQMVNPSIVDAQIRSGIVFGLTAALWGDITLDGGRVQQNNFDTYRLLRMDESPDIDVEILTSDAAPGGIGEPSTALVAPAVCNALFAATGRRLRSLPVARHGLT